jgi:hypothetical protein
MEFLFNDEPKEKLKPNNYIIPDKSIMGKVFNVEDFAMAPKPKMSVVEILKKEPTKPLSAPTEFQIDKPLRAKVDTVIERSKQYKPLITSTATEVAIDPYLLHAKINLESMFDPNAKRGVFYGLGQIGKLELMEMKKIGKNYDVNKIFEPETNVNAAGNYLKYMIDKVKKYYPELEGDELLRWGLTAYNKGFAGMRKTLVNGKLPEIRYASDILKMRDYLKSLKLYEKN